MIRNKRLVAVIMTAVLALGIVLAPITGARADTTFALSGTAHIQNVGDQAGTVNSEGALVLGSRGRSQRVEAFNIKLTNNSGISGTLQYRAHIQNIGWSNWTNAGSTVGTRGRALRIEAVEFRLTGDLANSYGVQYRTHVQNYGDAQGWVSNGTMSGTEGSSLRVEEIQVKIVPLSQCQNTPSISYRTHVQNIGWQDWRKDGAVAGTTGRSLRVEAIEIKLDSNTSGGISYKSHVQNIGWQGSVANGATSGTVGQGLRLEALQILLTGDVANSYEVYYRTHCQNYGWLQWARNGQTSGTIEDSYRVEAIQIVVIRKGFVIPGDIAGVHVNQGFTCHDLSWIRTNMQNRANGQSSKTCFLIMIDYTNCKCGIFQGSRNHWTLIKYFDIGPGADTSPTPSGTYAIKDKVKYFVSAKGFYCHYATRFHGAYYMHSVLYYKDGTVADPTVGAHVSHGCIRMEIDNAKWVYENCSKGTTVVVYR